MIERRLVIGWAQNTRKPKGHDGGSCTATNPRKNSQPGQHRTTRRLVNPFMGHGTKTVSGIGSAKSDNAISVGSIAKKSRVECNPGVGIFILNRSGRGVIIHQSIRANEAVTIPEKIID